MPDAMLTCSWHVPRMSQYRSCGYDFNVHIHGERCQSQNFDFVMMVQMHGDSLIHGVPLLTLWTLFRPSHCDSHINHSESTRPGDTDSLSSEASGWGGGIGPDGRATSLQAPSWHEGCCVCVCVFSCIHHLDLKWLHPMCVLSQGTPHPYPYPYPIPAPHPGIRKYWYKTTQRI